jgi:hypothetical protein
MSSSLNRALLLSEEAESSTGVLDLGSGVATLLLTLETLLDILNRTGADNSPTILELEAKSLS